MPDTICSCLSDARFDKAAEASGHDTHPPKV